MASTSSPTSVTATVALQDPVQVEVQYPLNLLKTRDKKEQELYGMQEIARTTETMVLRERSRYTKKLEEYKKWKIANNIPGIRY